MDKRTFGAVCAAVMIAVLLGTIVFLAGTADHECSGEHCLVCALAAELCRVLRLGLTPAAVLLGAAAVLCRGFRQVAVPGDLPGRTSPVRLKVKLSN